MLITENLNLKIKNRTLLHALSLQFEPGYIYGIIGPNGSGKTTLLKVLTGIWKASSGSVLWKGKNLHSYDRKTLSRTISLVSQNAQVNFDFSVAEIVEMGTYVRNELSAAEKKKLIQHALEVVDAWHLCNERASNISHGERQRIYIARSLVTQSPVLILDEPTSNLDIKHQMKIWQLLEHLKSEGKLLIVANHDLSTTKRYFDQLIVLNHGQCVSTGSFQETLTPSILSSVFGVSEEILYSL